MLLRLVLLSIATAVSAQQFTKARAILFSSKPGEMPGAVVGIVDFYQDGDGIRANGTINGLAAGQHGFHVHEKGDLSNGCLATGPHFNPLTKNHGAPTASDRHHGDLGNIQTPESGVTAVNIRDAVLTLNGPHSIIGRGLVVHEKPDDLGLGGSEASLTTGDAGARIACGVIGAVL